MADLTYVALATGFAYPAVILDAWSRRVIGYVIGRGLCARHAVPALERAVAPRRLLPGCMTATRVLTLFQCSRASPKEVYPSILRNDLIALAAIVAPGSSSRVAPLGDTAPKAGAAKMMPTDSLGVRSGAWRRLRAFGIASTSRANRHGAVAAWEAP